MGKSKQSKIRILDREENLGSAESVQGEASGGTSIAAGACKKQTACSPRRNINKACKRCEAPSNEGSEGEKTSQNQEKEVVELGLDISTSVIGIALVRLDGSCELLDHIKFSTKQEIHLLFKQVHHCLILILIIIVIQFLLLLLLLLMMTKMKMMMMTMFMMTTMIQILNQVFHLLQVPKPTVIFYNNINTNSWVHLAL